MLALTATAPPTKIQALHKTLCLNQNVKVIAVNPNRKNIFLEKKLRFNHHHGLKSYCYITIIIIYRTCIYIVFDTCIRDSSSSNMVTEAGWIN